MNDTLFSEQADVLLNIIAEICRDTLSYLTVFIPCIMPTPPIIHCRWLLRTIHRDEHFEHD